MSRPLFYPTLDALVSDPFGSPVARQQVRIYTAQTGGIQITDLLFVNSATGALGSAVPSGILISDGNGYLPAFASIDGGRDVVYADCGPYGSRTALVADANSGGAVSSVDGLTGAVTLSSTYATHAEVTAALPDYPDGTTPATAVPRPAEVDARDFGVLANGPTDSASLTANTAALQAFVTAVLTTKKSGLMPAGTIHINGQINFSALPIWRIRGAGRSATVIMQHANNTPILNLGSDTASFMHTWSLSGFSLDYAVTQSSANTLANPILFSTMAFNGEMRNIGFDKGSYAIRVADGIGGPWGNSWDDLQFGGGLTLGAMNWTNAVNGVPNNHWGRFTVHCDNAVGPVFAGLRGYNWRIDTIEFLSANLGPTLMEFSAGADVSIGALKLEVSSWPAARVMFSFLGNNTATIDQIAISNSVPTVNALPSGQALVILATGTSSPNGGLIKVGSIEAGNFSSITGTGSAYILSASSGDPIIVDRVNYGTDWTLTNIGSAGSADFISITNYVNNRLSQDRGDADYTPFLSDPNINAFSTPFTAPRTINLPSLNGDLFSGLYYEFVFNGAINGANTATIKCGATTLRTQTTDGAILRFTYRRNPSGAAGGWILTKNDITADSASTDAAFITALIYGS